MTSHNPLPVSQWQRIAFDPLSWIDPGRLSLPTCLTGVRCRSIVNQVLLSSLELTHAVMPEPLNGISRLFIREWWLLREAGFLLACQRYRASLALRGRIPPQPARVTQFSQLALLESQHLQGDSLLTVEMMHHRAALELLPFSCLLPEWLRQRLPLLFPPLSAEAKKGHGAHSADILLLKLAIQHAKRHPE
ncbi:hypothetical protein [Serratia quinivorans]|uniref:hypothetical protein n=1 Tax=Serratia quinivorans TaxID=137545 RepID=UPI003981CBA5